MTDVDALCADYVDRLDRALSNRSISQRQQIVEQITEHLNEARSELPVQSEAAVRSILERLGRPEDIASVAAAGEQTMIPTSSQSYKQKQWIQAAAVGVVIAGLGLTIGLLASRGSTPSGPTSAITHPTVPNAAPAVTVPVVLGQSIGAATAALQASGLGVDGIEGDPVGLVVSQDPSGGSRVPPGSAITLHTQPSPPSSAAS
jgi:hypothetical protein